MLEAVYNIKEWLVHYPEQLRDHTQPKCFKFIISVMLQGSVECCYQNYSHMPWEGPVVILKIQLIGFLIELPDLD